MGLIIRSKAACKDFQRETGFSKGREGYVVLFKKSLECGGDNAPANMEWVPTETAKVMVPALHKCHTGPAN